MCAGAGTDTICAAQRFATLAEPAGTSTKDVGRKPQRAVMKEELE